MQITYFPSFSFNDVDLAGLGFDLSGAGFRLERAFAVLSFSGDGNGCFST